MAPRPQRSAAPIKASDLKHRVAFDKRAEVDDGYGNTQASFEYQFTVDAAVRAKLGGEEVMAARLASRQPVNITVRQSSNTRQIDTGWRARDDRTGTVYAIRSIVDPGDDRRFFELLCETGTEP